MIQARGYEAAYLWFGLAQGLVIMLAALLLRAPQPTEVKLSATSSCAQHRRDYAPSETLRSSPFWFMYAMFVMVGTGGLMVTAQLAPVARDFAIDTAEVSMLGVTMPALSFALAMGLMGNGLSRPFFGWLSDFANRENTMFIAFLLEGFSILALLLFANSPYLFVLLSGLVFFAWGEIFALFPATCADTYGRRFINTNYGMLYTAKGTAALLVPFGNVLMSATGSWTMVFALASVLNFGAAILALIALKPARLRMLGKEGLLATEPMTR